MKKTIIFVIAALSFTYLVTAWEKGDPITVIEVIIAFTLSFMVIPSVLLLLVDSVKELFAELKKLYKTLNI